MTKLSNHAAAAIAAILIATGSIAGIVHVPAAHAASSAVPGAVLA